MSAALSQPPALIQHDLYFSQTLLNGDQVTPEQFQSFINEVITPRFPAGLTLYEAQGQAQNGSLTSTQVISLFVEDTATSEASVNEIVTVYERCFPGTRVVQAANTDELKVGFGIGENLIDNDPVPELIQVDLLFGRAIAGMGEVSPEQFQRFVDQSITPRFPEGLTVIDARGQFQDRTGTIIKEPSQAVSLILEDTPQNEAALDQIVGDYVQQFQQESVLQAVNEAITVRFGPDDQLIDSDSVPEIIQVDLFFGRNIAGRDEVSEAQFQDFVDEVIAPRFSHQSVPITVFDADGQFQDRTSTIIEENSKVVSLLLPDTQRNEAAINQTVTQYMQQFQQESVLMVVDEEIETKIEVESPACGIGRCETLLPDWLLQNLSVMVPGFSH
ncbi:MAG: DUF3574 domain-containing protein [Synechococcales cyanobacterium C42_A2020_086]|jgi:hypothetical protein|nr:DUF3574 domain-containing protein [Synechococcales cyanobacterium C42_A2020_086]